MPQLQQAQTFIQQAADLYVVASQHAEQHAQFALRLKEPVTQAFEALDADHPALVEPLKLIKQQMALAKTRALAQEHVQASELLDGVMGQIAEASRLVASANSCKDRLKALKDTTVPGLTTHTPPDQDTVIGEDIKALNRALLAIDKHLQGLKYAEAIKALDDAEVACDRATLKKKINAGGLTATQMTEQCKALATKPSGLAALDLLVKDLKKSQSVDGVLAAMKARFKLDDAQCDLATTEDAGKVTQELCALYDVMTATPDKHTRDNPSFKKIVRKPKGSGSSYSGGSKAINMSEGHPDTSSERVVAIETELPDTDDNSKPDPAATPTTFFDWNTWHEVGHAMDDRKQFMNKNGKKAEFGGWVKHGGDLLAVAEAVAGEFALPGVTAQHIAKYLDNGTRPSPLPANWAKIETWATQAGHGAIPWKQGANCGKSVKTGGLQAGGRIFHEGYAGDWYSYDPASRKQGITGYQFRAPGEWFSELYAAYKSKKLKSSHPARNWLDKLFAD